MTIDWRRNGSRILVPCQIYAPLTFRLYSRCTFQSPEVLFDAVRIITSRMTGTFDKRLLLGSKRLVYREALVTAIKSIDSSVIKQRPGPPLITFVSQRHCQCKEEGKYSRRVMMRNLELACEEGEPLHVIDAIMLFMERDSSRSVEGWKAYFAEALGELFIDACPRLSEVEAEGEASKSAQYRRKMTTLGWVDRIHRFLRDEPVGFSDAVGPPKYEECLPTTSQNLPWLGCNEVLPSYNARM